MSLKDMNFPGLLYGGDYNPEQWLDRPDILKKDIEMMKQAHINAVTLGVFSWAFLEPSEGEYRLDWLQKIVDSLYAEGIYVVLSTPSGARPRWLAERYPEVLRMDSRRIRNLYGARHNHCYTSPVYRKKVREIDQQLAARFKDHPGVILWHISNEFGGECHCPLCQDAFRSWIRNKYGSVDKLNHAWWTAFWSHTYTSFDQVESPSPLGDANLIGLNLDWNRFVTDQTADFLKEEVRALRDAGAHQPVTTNFMQWFSGLDYNVLSDYVDIVSWDNYPSWHQKPDMETADEAAFQHDYMRSLKHKPFLMMESTPSALNWQGVSKVKRPGMLALSSLQALAHGSDSVQFFQIRQSRGSSEKFHSAVIDHYGETDTRVFREVSRLGEDLAKVSFLRGTVVHSSAAIIYDIQSQWAMENSEGPRNAGLPYHESLMKAYRSLRGLGLNVDVIGADASLEGYSIVAAPMLYMFREGVSDRLKDFVAGGGTLIMTFWSGVADGTDLCYQGRTPAGLSDVLGLRREEIDALYDGESCRVAPVDDTIFRQDQEYTCANLCELVRLNDAKPLLVYQDEFYAGYPAATVHSYGAGEAYYLCADLELSLYEQLARYIVQKKGIRPVLENLDDLPGDVRVSSRCDGETEYVFLQHFGTNEVKVTLPPEADVILGDPQEVMKGYDTIIFRR